MNVIQQTTDYRMTKGILKNQKHQDIADNASEYSLLITRENTRVNTFIRSTEPKQIQAAKSKSGRHVRFQGEIAFATTKQPIKKDADHKPIGVEMQTNAERRPDLDTNVSLENVLAASPKAKPMGIFDIPMSFCGPELHLRSNLKSRGSDRSPHIENLSLGALSALVTEWQEASCDIFMSIAPSWINQKSLKSPTSITAPECYWT